MSHEHIYSILIVSSSAKFNMLSSYLFPIAEYWPVDTVPDAASAKQKMTERTYDIIVINTPLPVILFCFACCFQFLVREGKT